LTVLGLSCNDIRGLRPLAALTNLISLDLYFNSIRDVSSLVTNAGLCCGDVVSLGENPLDTSEAQADIQTLTNRGVYVSY
jgi:Leucine-rich repeat (LRR) protein